MLENMKINNLLRMIYMSMNVGKEYDVKQRIIWALSHKFMKISSVMENDFLSLHLFIRSGALTTLNKQYKNDNIKH